MKAHTQSGQLYYGWILAVTFGCMFFMANGSLAPLAAVSNPLMSQDLGMTAAQTSLGFSAMILMYGIGAPITGYLIARIGARRTQVIGGILSMLGAILMIFFVREVVLYTIAFACLGLATLFVGQMAVESTIGLWFTRYRGRAMTVVMVIGGLGAFGSPIIANALIETRAAWQGAWYFYLISGAIAIVLALTVVRNKPEDVGLCPDGIAPDDISGHVTPDADTDAPVSVITKPVQKRQRVFKNKTKISYKQAIRTPGYWAIVIVGATGFLWYALSTGLSTAQFTALGFDRMVIVSGVSFMGLAMLSGKFFWGVISDTIEPIRLMAMCDSLIAIAIVIGACAQNTMMLYIFYIVAGFSYGGIATDLATTIANYLGTSAFSKNLGTAMLCCGLSSAVIPFVGGLLFDFTGSYQPIFIGTAVCAACGAIVGFVLRIPKRS